MTEAIAAGAIAGAVAGAIAGLVVVYALRRSEGPRPGQWRSFTGRATVTPHAHSAYGSPPKLSAMSFDDFDESGKRVMAVAQDEAIRANHNYIGTEHLLAALVRADPDGPAGRTLARLGVSLDKVRTALEFIIGKGEAPVGPADITLSPRTRKVLELARDEARRLGRPKVGAAEILLGLVREGEGIASGILASLGIQLETMRLALIRELGTGYPSSAPGTAPEPQGQPPTRGYRGPFDRFNDRAKRALALAQDEAIRFNHNYMGPEHLLLGLVREGEGVAARALDALGIDMMKIRKGVELAVGRGDATTSPSEITLSPRTKKLIELAVDESRKLGHSHVGTEHLLLGLIRDDGSMACEILKAQGVTLEKIRFQVIATLGQQHPPPAG